MIDNNFYSIPMTETFYSDKKDIRRQSIAIAEERLDFLDGTPLGDVDIFIESGDTVRKVRRIMEKRVAQDMHKMEKHYYRSNYRRYHEKHRTSNHMKNIYGKVPTGFVFCYAS